MVLVRKIAAKTLIILNILAAIALLLSYSAPLISPDVLVFPAFFGLAYPYLLLLNVLFTTYWIIRLRKEFLLSLLIILLGWNHLQNLFPLKLANSGSDGGPGEQVKFMSYNVRTFDLYNWTKEDNSREEIFSLILAEDPAILCLQEFYTSGKPENTEASVQMSLKSFDHSYIYYGIQSRSEGSFGIATFSKYPILKTSRIPFNQTLNQAVYTDILVDSDTIRVFNIHLQSIRFAQRNYEFLDSLSLKYSNKQLEEMVQLSNQLGKAFRQRATQAQIIRRYIEASPHPVVVCGDFNDTPVSYAYRKIRKGLKDAFRTSGRGLGNTYAGDLPSFRIDYILYSDDLRSTGFRRIKSRFSDHYPITASIEVNITGGE